MILPLDMPLNLPATLACGQAFRWRPVEDGGYEGVVAGRHVLLFPDESGVRMEGDPPAELITYLDAERHYAPYFAAMEADPVLERQARFCAGMRILNQDPFECLISFILSANNNVARISGIIERLCDAFGASIPGTARHAFPTPEALAQADENALRACGTGYRAAYVQKTAQLVLDGFAPEKTAGLSYAETRKTLMRYPGVGGKVADCVLLFSCGYFDAFPVDVWIAREMGRLYPHLGGNRETIGAFAREQFKGYAGLAQQVIFHSARCSGLAE